MEIKRVYKVEELEFDSKQAAEEYLSGQVKEVHLDYDEGTIEFFKKELDWFEEEHKELKFQELYILPLKVDDFCTKIEKQAKFTKDDKEIIIHSASLYDLIFKSIVIDVIIRYVDGKVLFIDLDKSQVTRIFRGLLERLYDGRITSRWTAESILGEFTSVIVALEC